MILLFQDFKDSEYVYNAYFLKSLLIRSLFETQGVLSRELTKGTERGKNLFSQEDVDRLKEIFNFQLQETEIVTSDYLNLVIEVDNRYSSDKQDLTFPLKQIKENLNQETSIVYNFGNNGYPVPTKEDVEAYKQYLRIRCYNTFLSNVLKNNKVYYPSYFYYSAIHLIDKPVATKMLNKVVLITKNDKYNEMRIKAQEALNQSPKLE